MKVFYVALVRVGRTLTRFVLVLGKQFRLPPSDGAKPCNDKRRVEPIVLVARSAQAGRWSAHRARLFHPDRYKTKAGP